MMFKILVHPFHFWYPQLNLLSGTKKNPVKNFNGHTGYVHESHKTTAITKFYDVVSSMYLLFSASS